MRFTKRPPVQHPVTGTRQGKLTVVGAPFKQFRKPRNTEWYYPVQCDCGKQFNITRSNLQAGSSKCADCRYDAHTSHGDAGNTERARLYRIWQNIKQRCYNCNTPNYKYYGGKGITLCEDWHNYNSFKLWATANGYNDTLVLDRIDTTANYLPQNCRWITAAENTKRAFDAFQ